MFVNWFFQSGLKQGVFWGIMVYVVCAMNDVLMRILGDRLHFIEISFFRFLFSFLSVAAIVHGKKISIASSMHKMHFARSVVGAVSLTMCCLSVKLMPLAENASILFSEAIFMLPMSAIFLREKIIYRTLFATVIGVIGLLIIFKPSSNNFNINALIPTAAALLFSVQNIMIKKMVDSKENNMIMLYYFGLYTMLISGIFVPSVWLTPTIHELFLLILLGCGANLLQLFMFLAYRATSAANLSPLRYTELIFSVILGYLFFDEIPTLTVIAGAIFIVCGTCVASIGKHERCGCCS